LEFPLIRKEAMSECTVASFDIGGTSLRAAVLSITGNSWRMLDQQRHATPNYLSTPETPASERLDGLLDFIVEYAELAQTRFSATGLSAAFPGPVQGRGVLLALPTMLGPDSRPLFPIDIADSLAVRLPGMSIRVLNDVSAAGYRFVPEGSDFAIFTLGSGIGLKVFIDGKPRVGPHGFGGELTHMVFDRSLNAPMCDCGDRGHLGALASGRAWQRKLKALAPGQQPDLLQFAEPLSRAVAMLHFSMGLERFIFAGGLADGLGEALRAAIVQNLPSQGWNVGQNWDAMIELAPADDAHALIGGALALCLEIY
jgi:C7-cyclitol 7-kinase